MTAPPHDAVGAAVERLSLAAARRGLHWRIGSAGKGDIVAVMFRTVPHGTGAEDVLCGIGPTVPEAVANLAERATARTGT